MYYPNFNPLVRAYVRTLILAPLTYLTADQVQKLPVSSLTNIRSRSNDAWWKVLMAQVLYSIHRLNWSLLVSEDGRATMSKSSWYSVSHLLIIIWRANFSTFWSNSTSLCIC